MPDDPLRPNPDPFRPPEPYREPYSPPAQPPFAPVHSPYPTSPTQNPWQNPTDPAGFGSALRSEMGTGWLSGGLGSFNAIKWVVALLFFGLISTVAHAAAVGGGGTMPWDTALTNLRTDLTGPTAGALSLIGIVLVMGILIFGGELNIFGRSLCFLILTASVLVAGQSLLTALGITGATVANETAFDAYSAVSGALIASLMWALGIVLHKKWRAHQARQLQILAGDPAQP